MIAKPNRHHALSVIHAIALQHGLKTATAESLTAGKVTAALASLSGSSGYHQGGIAAYNIEAKVNLLGVDREIASACNCVSDAVVMQMARGAQAAFGADCVIATTGYAEPWREGGIPEAFACFAIICGDTAMQGFMSLDGMSRELAREAVTTRTLALLAGVLEGQYEAK
jgi:nicotinamide-nucleotide amidase